MVRLGNRTSAINIHSQCQCIQRAIESIQVFKSDSKKVEIRNSIMFDYHKLLVLRMYNESWKMGDWLLNAQQSKQESKSNEFLEKVLITHQKPQKQKNITFTKFFDFKEQAQFSVAIAKFSIIFNIDIDQMSCLKKLSLKQRNNIKNFNFESILADTNLKQFSKSFKKSMNPQVSLSAAHSNSTGLVFVIQNSESEKLKVNFLTYQNLMHSILNNVKANNKYEQLDKFLDLKYKKIQTVVCYQKVNIPQINIELYEFLQQKFQQVFYVGVMPNQENRIDNYQSQPFNIQNKCLTFYKSHNWVVLGPQPVSKKAIEQIFKYYDNYSKADALIVNQVKKSKINKNLLTDNQLCINYYGLFYNFIILNGLYKKCNQSQASKMFLDQFIKQKQMSLHNNQKKEKKVYVNRGHYPGTLVKGSKVCCVCEKDKKKKSRYKCLKCTETYSKEIAICIDHFKEFHCNIPKYLPKGVKVGTHQNEILQFKDTKMVFQQCPTKKQIPKKEVEKSGKDVTQIINKWNEQIAIGEECLKHLAQLFISKQMNKSNVIPSFMYYNQYYYPEINAHGYYQTHVKQETQMQAEIYEKKQQHQEN